MSTPPTPRVPQIPRAPRDDRATAMRRPCECCGAAPGEECSPFEMCSAE
ncbi:hypothetical protein ACGF3G_00650 [Streptomyces sp. NPDC048179]